MMSEWIVVLEATASDSTADLDETTLSHLIEAVADSRPVALYSADRYAVQLLVTAPDPGEALGLVLRRWSEAVRSLGAPTWGVVRADVMTLAEFGLEFEVEQDRPRSGSAPTDSYGGKTLEATGPDEMQLAGIDIASELRWRLMLQDSHERLMLLSADGAVFFSLPPLDPAFVLSNEGRPTSLADIVHPDDSALVREAVARLLAGDTDTVTFVMRLLGGDGWRSHEATARNLLQEPLVRAIVVNSEDVTRQRELEARVTELARYDELTGLANRAVFLDSLELALARSAERSQTGVFFVDIDNFRGLVERVGTEVGDRVLVTLGDRLRTGVRDRALASRLGRDEFALLCEDVADSFEAAQIARRMADLLSEPVVLEGDEYSVTVSIGVALGKGRVQAATLLRHAEVAMYRARRGRARYEIFRRRRRSPAGSDETT